MKSEGKNSHFAAGFVWDNYIFEDIWTFYLRSYHILLISKSLLLMTFWYSCIRFLQLWSYSEIHSTYQTLHFRIVSLLLSVCPGSILSIFDDFLLKHLSKPPFSGTHLPDFLKHICKPIWAPKPFLTRKRKIK